MFSWKTLYLIIGALLVPSAFASRNDETTKLIIALNKLINYLILNYTKVNVNCLFGIVIAEAQLNLILENPINIRKYSEIKQLRQKCHELIEIIEPNIIASTKYIKNILKHVMKTELWQVNSIFLEGELEYLKPYIWDKAEPLWTEYIMFDGHPNEQQSDLCINELIEMSSNHLNHKCIPNEMCRAVMFDLNSSHGYPLTHKLLFMQIARALNCSDKKILQSITNNLCSRILQEHRSIEIANEPKLRDLYLEQMVLCGMEGYTEFLDQKARESLLQWQTKGGCYGNGKEKVPFITDRWQTKQISERPPEKCSNHFSGLAVAAYALNLRYLEYTE